MKKYRVIGLMSGSSMDGVDIALCEIYEKDNTWHFEICHADTVPYSDIWRIRLSKLRKQDALTYAKTDVFYGHYLGGLVRDFIEKNNLKADIVGSHGHTVFHSPDIRITRQVGDGASLSAVCGLPVVSDFRSMDVAKGGEGAPLVAIGDQLLFGEFDYCLNLGGFANISANVGGKRIAYDICAANILLNRVARDLGMDYDEDGRIAEKGSIDYPLLKMLNNIEFFSRPYPKSLNRDWINDELWGHVRQSGLNRAEDKMKTLVDHIGFQVGTAINQLSDGDAEGKTVLVTGGGAFNKALMDHIGTHTDAKLVIPDDSVVKYKEALVFAFLTVLRAENRVNIWSSCTGASSDSISGALHGDFSFTQKI